ncbi:MAG: hypothetical protein EOP06_20560, partial [Proteobacteria bacterium]
DERRRAEALFGNKLEQQQAVIVNQPQVIQAPPPQPVVVATPAPVPVVIAPEPKEDVRGIIREELRAKAEKDELQEPPQIRYFSGIAGVSDYSDASNVRGNYTIGAAFGTKYDMMILEGSFLMSSFDVEQRDYGYTSAMFPKMIDTSQYQGAIAAKYQMMSGMVRPVLGGIAAYSYRQYKWKDVYQNGMIAYRGNSSDSHAIDLGVSAGVDLEFTKKFSLGFEYRYMFNLSSRTSDQSVYSTGLQSGYGTPIEKLSYYTLALAAKVNF